VDEAVGGSVGYALAIAISPIPIAALILTLLSVRPRSSSIAFTTGWIGGIGVVASIAVVTGLFDAGAEPSDRRGWIRLTIGVVLVLAALRRWQTRPRRGDEPSTPPLMRAIDGAGAVGVLGIGFALAALNPKDMLLAAAGGAEIAAADLPVGSTVATLVVFTAIAASTAIIPVGAYLVAGHRLDDRLHRSREWLIRHNPVVMAVVLVAVGALFIAEGIQILGG
jgi:threonine/homoserine/homoserine lactone efflux protein